MVVDGAMIKIRRIAKILKSKITAKVKVCFAVIFACLFVSIVSLCYEAHQAQIKYEVECKSNWRLNLTSPGDLTSSIHAKETIARKPLFITYANRRYATSKARILKEAKDTGWFESVRGFGPEDLPFCFAHHFRHILRRSRGAGFWIWKYAIIMRVLETMEEGDVVVYLDAGAVVNPLGQKRFDEYVDMLTSSKYDVISFNMGHQPEHVWTTKAIFDYFNVSDADSMRTTGQNIGGVLFMKKGPHIRAWLRMVERALDTDPWLFTDKYDYDAKRANVEFVENRHDQSVFSVSRKIAGSIVLTDETYPSGREDFPVWTHVHYS